MCAYHGLMSTFFGKNRLGSVVYKYLYDVLCTMHYVQVHMYYVPMYIYFTCTPPTPCTQVHVQSSMWVGMVLRSGNNSSTMYEVLCTSTRYICVLKPRTIDYYVHICTCAVREVHAFIAIYSSIYLYRVIST